MSNNFIDLMQELATETDNKFLIRSKKIISYLREDLRNISSSFLDRINDSVKIYPIEVIYIPIQHSLIKKDIDLQIEKELYDILKSIVYSSKFIISGETATSHYDKTEIAQERLSTLSSLSTLGAISQNSLMNPNLLDSLIPGHDRAIIKIINENKNVHGYGVESSEGAILATCMEMDPRAFIANNYDSSYSNEIKYRIGIEGRTRYSLNHAAKISKGMKSIVFIQGALHVYGVREWCKRNRVLFKIVIPSMLKNSEILANL